MSLRDGAETAVRDIRRKTRKQYSAEGKIRIVLSGLRGEDSIAELCRREGIAESLYYSWSKEFLEAGKKRLSGDTARQASSGEVKDLRCEMHDLKEALAEQVLENRLFKKSMIGDGETAHEIPRIGEARDHPPGRAIPPPGPADAGQARHPGNDAFYRWYDRYRAVGETGLEDRTSGPGRVWNRIPDNVRRQIVELALDEPELSPRELAVTFTDTRGYFVSEASV